MPARMAAVRAGPRARRTSRSIGHCFPPRYLSVQVRVPRKLTTKPMSLTTLERCGEFALAAALRALGRAVSVAGPFIDARRLHAFHRSRISTGCARSCRTCRADHLPAAQDCGSRCAAENSSMSSMAPAGAVALQSTDRTDRAPSAARSCRLANDSLAEICRSIRTDFRASSLLANEQCRRDAVGDRPRHRLGARGIQVFRTWRASRCRTRNSGRSFAA